MDLWKTKIFKENIIYQQNSIWEKKSSVRNNLYLANYVNYEQLDFIQSTQAGQRGVNSKGIPKLQNRELTSVLVSDQKKNHRSDSKGQGKYSYVSPNDIRRLGKY